MAGEIRVGSKKTAATDFWTKRRLHPLEIHQRHISYCCGAIISHRLMSAVPSVRSVARPYPHNRSLAYRGF